MAPKLVLVKGNDAGWNAKRSRFVNGFFSSSEDRVDPQG